MTQKTVRTRKTHTCEYCKDVIKKGEIAKTRSTPQDGYWITDYFHNDCPMIATECAENPFMKRGKRGGKD
jgi:hypothetical protein